MEAGQVGKKLGMAAAVLLLAGVAGAQGVGGAAGGLQWRAPASALGLSPARAEMAIGCGASLLPCRNAFEAANAARFQDSLRWSMELGSGSLALPAGRQGLSVSFVGRQPMSLFGNRFSLYGKLGTAYGLADPALAAASMPAAESGYGLSFGAGVSMDLTRRLSASFGFDSYDLRLGGGPRDPVRATSLGLQYRY